MTTTPELHELATDPQAFDTVLAGLHDKRGEYVRTVQAGTDRLHSLAKDRKSYRNTRVPVWGLSDKEVIQEAQRKAAHGDLVAAGILTARAGSQALLDAVDFEIANMDAVYMRLGNRWTRFFPSITKSQPHIHRSLNCRTLHPTTVMTWAPQLSGKTDSQAVAELDEALCSVCFPDAPVSLHTYVSRKSQAEKDIRQAEKDERDAKRAAKQLTEAEQFRTRYGNDKVTTVAALKELIRRAVEQPVEIEWNDRPEAAARWSDRERYEQYRRNLRDNLAKMEQDAKQAERILVAREDAHEGWGMTEKDIDLMMARKDKSARKEWGL